MATGGVSVCVTLNREPLVEISEHCLKSRSFACHCAREGELTPWQHLLSQMDGKDIVEYNWCDEHTQWASWAKWHNYNVRRHTEVKLKLELLLELLSAMKLVPLQTVHNDVDHLVRGTLILERDFFWEFLKIIPFFSVVGLTKDIPFECVDGLTSHNQ